MGYPAIGKVYAGLITPFAPSPDPQNPCFTLLAQQLNDFQNVKIPQFSF
jgi:hypothetical protein